jgi:predicted nuclease of predicted toxin-antitoxin system
MSFLADECLYYSTVKLLKNHNYDVITLSERKSCGIKDREVAELAKKEQRILITRDMHFCNILKFPPKSYSGIIVLKINPNNATLVHGNLLKFLKKYAINDIKQTLVIINHGRFRIRK